MIKTTALLFLLSTFGQAAQRVDVTRTGSKSDTEFEIGYQYKQEAKDEAIVWSPAVTFTSNRAKIRDSSTGEVDRTNQIWWVNNFNLYNNVYVEANLGGSNTKSDELSSRKVELKLGSDFGEEIPLSWSVGVGRNKISQGKAQPSLDKLELDQQSLNYSLSLDALDWLIVSFYGAQYDYDQNLEDQINLLGTPGAVRIYGTAFYDTLTSLPKEAIGLQASVITSEKWSFSLDLGKTTDAPNPQVESASLGATVNYQFDANWDMAGFLGSTTVESTSTNSEEKFGYVGISLGYTWE
jgi:hypothetical protein